MGATDSRREGNDEGVLSEVKTGFLPKAVFYRDKFLFGRSGFQAPANRRQKD
jgi:hypothetical protein